MVIDTGIFIEYLRLKDKTATILYKLANYADLYISSVSLYKLYIGATNKDKEQDIVNLTESLFILPFTDPVAMAASKIYHQLRLANQMIEFRDIFIAATCIVNHLPIVTLNSKHFTRIGDLEIVKL